LFFFYVVYGLDRISKGGGSLIAFLLKVFITPPPFWVEWRRRRRQWRPGAGRGAQIFGKREGKGAMGEFLAAGDFVVAISYKFE